MENIVEQLKPKDWEERKDVNEDVMITKKIKLNWSLARSLLLITAFVITPIMLVIVAVFLFFNSFSDDPIKFSESAFGYIFGVVFIVIAALATLDPKGRSQQRNSDGSSEKIQIDDTHFFENSNPTISDPAYSSVEGNIFHD
ncbi:MAG: hypothetical protein K0U21_06270 [Proteobacteria bacterium]|nr:hypothetical protein [Pseudomonadota bacterium]